MLIVFPDTWVPRNRQEQLRQFFVDDKAIAAGRAHVSGTAEKIFYSLLFVAFTRPLLVTLGLLSLPGIIGSLLLRWLG
jgi:hypothetical protein